MFPIGTTPKAVETALKGQAMSADAKRVIASQRPYKGGNDPLYRLHRIDIADKHRVLLTVGSAYRHVNVKFAPFEGSGLTEDDMPSIALRPADRLFPLRDGVDLFIAKAKTRTEGDMPEPSFAFEVAFGEGEYVQGEPVAETLSGMRAATVAAIDALSPLLQAKL